MPREEKKPGQRDRAGESGIFRHLKRKKPAAMPKIEKPAFQENTERPAPLSFRRQMRAFRRSGLGRFDAAFNAFYIRLCERSVEKEKKRLAREGKEETPALFLELNSFAMRALAALLRGFRQFFGAIYAIFSVPRDAALKNYRTRADFVRTHGTHIASAILVVFAAVYIFFVLHTPISLQAMIGNNAIGIVTSKNVVESAVRQLEENTATILGKDFQFPYTVTYRFVQGNAETVSTKNDISDKLYSFVSDYICTAGGLYVDGTLVAVCENAAVIQGALDEFLAANLKGATLEDGGYFNEIAVVTQAYPTQSILTREKLLGVLKEMAIPLKNRESGKTANSGSGDETPSNTAKSVTDKILVSDMAAVVVTAAKAHTNQPEGPDGVELQFYRSVIETQQQETPYRTVYVESAERYTSMADVTTPGKNGLASVRVKVYYVNGEEAKREVISSDPIRQPTDEVVSIGIRYLPEDLGVTDFKNRFILPYIGIITSRFGSREDGLHRAIDIYGKKGSNIYAGASGKVVVAIGPGISFSEYRDLGYYASYGYCVVIDHGNGYHTLYGHCDSICVTPGQVVKQGEKIAEIGDTGNASGFHVHYEVIENDVRIDPEKGYLYNGAYTIYEEKPDLAAQVISR